MNPFPYRLQGYFHEDDSRKFTLTAKFNYQPSDLKRIIVPKGFTTDWNSVPGVLWTYFAPWEYPEAGLVHDWLYHHPGGLTRQQCDAVHRRILELKGCRKTKAYVIYLTLRIFGGLAWNAHREHDPKI